MKLLVTAALDFFCRREKSLSFKEIRSSNKKKFVRLARRVSSNDWISLAADISTSFHICDHCQKMAAMGSSDGGVAARVSGFVHYGMPLLPFPCRKWTLLRVLTAR